MLPKTNGDYRYINPQLLKLLNSYNAPLPNATKINLNRGAFKASTSEPPQRLSGHEAITKHTLTRRVQVPK